MRRGMWVIHDDEIGIIYAIGDGAAEVHRINEAGETTDKLICATSALRQATIEEIPECRRPSAEVGAPLGYV